MTRPIIHHTIEEKRAANNLSAKKYKAKKRAEEALAKEQGLDPKERKPRALKELPISYTREYHQERYRRLKEAKKASELVRAVYTVLQ
jgi:hypothetical protein